MQKIWTGTCVYICLNLNPNCLADTIKKGYPNRSEVDGRIKEFALKKLKYIASILITVSLGAILMDSLYKKLLNRNTQDSKEKTPIICF